MDNKNPTTCDLFRIFLALSKTFLEVFGPAWTTKVTFCLHLLRQCGRQPTTFLALPGFGSLRSSLPQRAFWNHLRKNWQATALLSVPTVWAVMRPVTVFVRHYPEGSSSKKIEAIKTVWASSPNLHWSNCPRESPWLQQECWIFG